MRRFIIGGLLIAVVGLVSASRVQADGIDTFTYTFDGNTFVWQLPSSPTSSTNPPLDPKNVVPGISFAILDVPFSENGVAQTPSEFDFFNASIPDGGGFQIITLGLTSPANTFGAQLYGGTEGAPKFKLGTFKLNNGSSTGPIGTLVISSSSVSAPEPNSLILLGSGLLSLLGFARKKLLA